MLYSTRVNFRCNKNDKNKIYFDFIFIGIIVVHVGLCRDLQALRYHEPSGVTLA